MSSTVQKLQSNEIKALARNYFYENFLPNRFNQEELRNSKILVLLGQERHELEVILKSRIPPNKITSVEQIQETYLHQMIHHRVDSYYGSLEQFFTYIMKSGDIFTDERYAVMNLDICGSYKDGILKILSIILDYCRRNPRTVVASYHSCGRDDTTLFEGLKYLVASIAANPKSTKKAVEVLFGQYKSAKLNDKVSFNMILRDFFWVFSHMENAIKTSTTKQFNNSGTVLADAIDSFWLNFVASEDISESIKFKKVFNIASDIGFRFPDGYMMDLRIEPVTKLVYAGLGTFWQKGWFTVYKTEDKILSVNEWLTQSLNALTQEPLLFANKKAKELKAFNGYSDEIPKDFIEPVKIHPEFRRTRKGNK